MLELDLFLFSTGEISYKPEFIKISCMGIDEQYFTGTMMGALENIYGVYFPSDGEVVYIHPNHEDVDFLP